mgnify:CR=1 FL=1
MSLNHTELSNEHINFIDNQNIFFVGTISENGHINLSPKGQDSIRVINSSTIVWRNLTGSGNKSFSHILNNPRMSMMFCAFNGTPLILRICGQARALHRNDLEWSKYIDLFSHNIDSRQIFIFDISQVESSDGLSVPLFSYQGNRDYSDYWSQHQHRKDIEGAKSKKNQRNMDDLKTDLIKQACIRENASLNIKSMNLLLPLRSFLKEFVIKPR